MNKFSEVIHDPDCPCLTLKGVMPPNHVNYKFKIDRCLGELRGICEDCRAMTKTFSPSELAELFPRAPMGEAEHVRTN